MKSIIREPIELNSILYKDLNKKCYIDFSKIIKYYIDYLQYKVGEVIKHLSNRKWLDKRFLDKRFTIEQQEKDLLFELEKYKDYFIHCINFSLPCIHHIEIKYEVKTATGAGEENHIITKELILVKILLEFFQPAVRNDNYQKIEIELPYYITLESEKGWH